MPGRFEGLTDEQWLFFKAFLPPEPLKKGRGMPKCDFRRVLNTQLYILITGARWCDIPQEPKFAPMSTSHRWMRRWEKEGVYTRMQTAILAAADMSGKIDWSTAIVDGSFFPSAGRRT